MSDVFLMGMVKFKFLFSIFKNEATAGYVQRPFAQYSQSVRPFVKAKFIPYV